MGGEVANTDNRMDGPGTCDVVTLEDCDATQRMYIEMWNVMPYTAQQMRVQDQKQKYDDGKMSDRDVQKYKLMVKVFENMKPPENVNVNTEQNKANMAELQEALKELRAEMGDEVFDRAEQIA